MIRGIREITKRRFDAFCYVREPIPAIMFKEVAWFEAFNGKLFGVVVMDRTDGDFGYMILGRDKKRVFRGIKCSVEFRTTKERAIRRMEAALLVYQNDGQDIYPQGDEKAMPNEILMPQVQEEKLHPYFKVLTQVKGHSAARDMIREIAYSYIDVDGNYIKDFQTTGFDGRLWELYLYMYLHVSRFNINRGFQAPDYVLSYYGEECCVEAVTVNANPAFDEPSPKNDKEAMLLSRDYMPIKFGSPLFSKLQKKYWEKPHVQGKPFILAIQDFHMPATIETLGSMSWSRTALSDYLYGVRMKYHIGENDKVVIETEVTENGVAPITEDIASHSWKGKKIPSNFFLQPDSENISAVLFSNNATLTTFNRMGKLAGLGEEKVSMIRFSSQYNPDPFATDPIHLMLDVDSPDYEESWADGLVMYHNPYAKYPVNPRMFPNISHMYFDIEKKQVYGNMIPFTVLSSFTLVTTFVDDKNEKEEQMATASPE